MEKAFCLAALTRVLGNGVPAVFNTDQGAEFTGQLREAGVMISMDGRGRCVDNIFVERLWRSLRYEEVYVRDYADGHDAHKSLMSYIRFYNRERRHHSLAWRTPEEVYRERPSRQVQCLGQDRRRLAGGSSPPPLKRQAT